ncbi:MAG: YraN family protein [Rhodospirillales bacterium]|nr:MAG: YraN family protein [Rhodospirillales bacterium]
MPPRRPSASDPKRVAADRFGRWAEWRCVWRLRLTGHRVLARRLRTPVGEIDIVARRGGTLLFIEVKARATVDDAALALTESQLRRIARAAEAFVARHPALADHAMRFDAMYVTPRGWPVHATDAWRPGS